MSILGFVWWGFPRRQITNYRLVKLCDFLWLATSPFFWLAQMSFNNQESSWGVSTTRTVRIRNSKEGSSLSWNFWLTRNIFCRSCATFTNFFFSYFLLLYLLPPKLDLEKKKYQLISKTKKTPVHYESIALGRLATPLRYWLEAGGGYQPAYMEIN